MIQHRAVLDYTKLAWMILLGAVVYSEFLAYYSAYSRWPSLPDAIKLDEDDKVNPSKVARILLVADPQIQGYLHEGTFGSIRRWDIDRYLSKNYAWAVSAYNPNVIIFLGDLLDEGSEANDDDYADYVSRFKAIYGLYKDSSAPGDKCGSGDCDAIYIPGDNDIGGEDSNFDPITAAKVRRFEQNFPVKAKYTFHPPPPAVTTAAAAAGGDGVAKANLTLEVIPVNTIYEAVRRNPKLLAEDQQEMNQKDADFLRGKIPSYAQMSASKTGAGSGPKPSNTVRLVISHLPILPYTRRGRHDVISNIQPSLVFSAHEHHGMDYQLSTKASQGQDDSEAAEASPANITRFSQRKTQGDREALKEQNSFHVYQLHQSSDDEQLHEVVVPTASYRMGEREMALGIAILDLCDQPVSQPKVLHYANLWLPSRFGLLFVYVAAVVSAGVIYLVGKIQRCRHGRQRGGLDHAHKWKRRRSSGSASSPSPRNRSRGRGSRSHSREKLHYSKLV